VTYATNALEGGTVPLALLGGGLLAGWGVSAGGSPRRLLSWAFGTTLVILVVYGLWHGGFPAPSEIGWSLL